MLIHQYKDSCSDVNLVTQPGHFTNVYLESLQRATEYGGGTSVYVYHKVVIRQSRLKVQDCEVEDIEIGW